MQVIKALYMLSLEERLEALAEQVAQFKQQSNKTPTEAQVQRAIATANVDEPWLSLKMFLSILLVMFLYVYYVTH